MLRNRASSRSFSLPADLHAALDAHLNETSQSGSALVSELLRAHLATFTAGANPVVQFPLHPLLLRAAERHAEERHKPLTDVLEAALAKGIYGLATQKEPD
jgi:hypothetical protein